MDQMHVMVTTASGEEVTLAVVDLPEGYQETHTSIRPK